MNRTVIRAYNGVAIPQSYNRGNANHTTSSLRFSALKGKYLGAFL
jgi:hypothetical protein